MKHLVVQRLKKNFLLVFVLFFMEMPHCKPPPPTPQKKIFKTHCMHDSGNFGQAHVFIQQRERNFKTSYRCLVYFLYYYVYWWISYLLESSIKDTMKACFCYHHMLF